MEEYDYKNGYRVQLREDMGKIPAGALGTCTADLPYEPVFAVWFDEPVLYEVVEQNDSEGGTYKYTKPIHWVSFKDHGIKDKFIFLEEDKEFAKMSNFVKENINGKNKCRYCDSEYETEEEYEKHLNETHVKCAQCNTVFNVDEFNEDSITLCRDCRRKP